MGAGGMYPNQSYPGEYNSYQRPYQYHNGYPPHPGMGYGRGYHRPSYPVYHGPMMGTYRPPPGGVFFNPYRSPAGGGLQSSPPSATPNGNLQMHRPHFDNH